MLSSASPVLALDAPVRVKEKADAQPLKNSRRILVFSNMSQPAEIIFTGRFMGLRSGSCDI